VKWEGHWLRVFENRVLREIFETVTEQVKGTGSELCSAERHNLFCSPIVTWVVKWSNEER